MILSYCSKHLNNIPNIICYTNTTMRVNILNLIFFIIFYFNNWSSQKNTLNDHLCIWNESYATHKLSGTVAISCFISYDL